MAKDRRRSPGSGRISATAVLPALGFAVLAAGCVQTKDVGLCPRVAILADAGHLVKFRPGQPETAENVIFRGRMTDVRIKCKYRDQLLTELEADVIVTMVLERGPAMQGNVAEFPYFVSVADRRGTVVQKREFPIKVNFGSDRAVEHTETSWQYYRLQRGFGGIEYENWVGYQLNDAELAYNRRTFPR
jgi:hypothetical protein